MHSPAPPGPLRPFICGLCVFAWFTTLAFRTEAQPSAQLRVETIQVGNSGGPVNFTFSDFGTGATNYVVEFSDDLGANTGWQINSNAVVTALGGGSYSVQIIEPQPLKRFFRVNGLGGTNGPIVIGFSMAVFNATEGDQVFPMLVLSQPFNGLVHYSVSGTAMSGDYIELNGQVMVNGTTAVIPVALTDNQMIGQLKYLTLRLEGGAGYQLGANSAATINIQENDAAWQGTFVTEDATLGFVLTIQESNSVHTASLTGAGSGFFPTTPAPATLLFTANQFSASIEAIAMPAGATLLNEPMTLSLSLSAMNGLTNQSVSSTLVEGVGTLISVVPAKPYLNSTNTGVFQLLKPPVSPSTNQVNLVTVP